MLNLKEADVTQPRFYQEVLQIGRQERRQQEINLVMRLLTRRCGMLSIAQQEKVRSFSLPQLESLGEALLDFNNLSDLENWFVHNSLNL